MESYDKNENNENQIISQRAKKGELEIISEEKIINCSEENTNKNYNKKSVNSSINNSRNRNMLNYSPKYLFEKDENLEYHHKKINKTCDLINYLSESKDKNNNTIEEEMPTNSDINKNMNNILSKSYNGLKDVKILKEGIDNNNKKEFPLTSRLNLDEKLNESKEKEKNNKELSKKGALKILELLTYKKKEKEELEKKKEELMIETFKKARNENDIFPPKENENFIINKDKTNENSNNNNIKENTEIENKENNLIIEENSSNKIEEIKENENINNNVEINNKIELNEKENKDNENKDILSLSSNKSTNKTINENNKEPNMTKISTKQSNNNNSSKNKVYIKNSRKYLKKPINPSNSKNSYKSSFSISKEKPKISKQKRNKIQNEAVIRHKSYKKNSYIIENQNKNKKNKKESNDNKNTKDNYNTLTLYKKNRSSKSPKGTIYAPKKALNPRGNSINKNNANTLLSKSNININNVNYINNINAIIKNKNENNFDDDYNNNDLIKLNNSLNINMQNNDYNSFINDSKYIDNYSKYNKNEIKYNVIQNFNSNYVNNNQRLKKRLIDSKNNNNNLKIRRRIVEDNDNENGESEYFGDNIKYNKNSLQIKQSKELILNKFTPDKNITQINNIYKNTFNTNPKRNTKNPKNIQSIYQNNNLSQRYYIYNNNTNQDSNNNESTSKFNSHNFLDINNDIITTEGTNTNTNNKFDNYLIDYDTYNNSNKNSCVSVNLEDLMIFEEKLSEIIYFLKNRKEVRNQCFDFWNYFFNSSLLERIEKIFKNEKNIEIAKFSINLELISVMICYEFSFELDILIKSIDLLLEILELSHGNLMIICENILMKIIPESQKNIWVLKLNTLVKNSKKIFNTNLSQIELIEKNSSEISNTLQKIFSTFETEYSPLIYTLYKKIHQKSYSEINDFFIEYILKIENKESSIIAPVLMSSNPNFISFRPPYIHTERIKPYTLILDLNDTIVNFQQTNNSQGILRLRPFLLEFLEEISSYYELILFTTSTEYFSKPIINAIEENKKYFDFIFYREYAIIVGNDFVKDLTRVGRALDSTIIVDNMPQNFRLQKENGIHIKPFYAQDPNDNTLIDLMNILINIAKSGIDVREGLADYRNDIVQKVTSNIYKYNI